MLTIIISHLVLLILVIAATLYSVHQKYPFEWHKPFTVEQRIAVGWRAFVYLLLMNGISFLIIFPVSFEGLIGFQS